MRGKPISKNKTQNIIRLYKRGLKYREIKAQTGAAQSTIARVAREAGIAIRRTQIPNGTAKIIKMQIEKLEQIGHVYTIMVSNVPFNRLVEIISMVQNDNR